MNESLSTKISKLLNSADADITYKINHKNM